MKLLAVICIIAIIGAGFATAEEEANTKIGKMEASEYGKTLLDTIQLELTAEGPVEDLIRMLQNSQSEL
jgi:hypothetical protein